MSGGGDGSGSAEYGVRGEGSEDARVSSPWNVAHGGSTGHDELPGVDSCRRCTDSIADEPDEADEVEAMACESFISEREPLRERE